MNESTSINNAPGKGDNHTGNYFFTCPVCQGEGVHIPLWRSNFFVCLEHKVAECVGENLFSHQWDNTIEQWTENIDILISCGLKVNREEAISDVQRMMQQP